MSFYFDTKDGSTSKVNIGDNVRVKFKVFLCEETVLDLDRCKGCASHSKNPIQVSEQFEFKVGAGAVHDFIDTNIVGMLVAGTRRFLVSSDDAFEEVGIKKSKCNDYIVPPNSNICCEIQVCGKTMQK